MMMRAAKSEIEPAPSSTWVRVAASNEWDTLRSVVVGTIEGARVPLEKDRALHAIDYPGLSDVEFRALPCGPYPEQVIEETAEDLARFCEQLTALGIEVHRPATVDFAQREKPRGSSWSTDGYYNYCPRDSVAIIGERALAAPMVLRHRQRESRTLDGLIEPAAWLECPRPALSDALYDPTAEDGYALLDTEPAFDAANLLRFDRDILYLVSNTGNQQGAALLQGLLGSAYRVHVVADVYRDRHVDTTFLPLKEGLLLCNTARVRESDIPAFLRSWDILWSPEMVELPALDAWCPASKWIGMNLLSLGPKLAAVEEHQEPLMRALESHGIESLPVRLRHSRTLGGGPHCITVDLVRTAC
jgi:scyllo-inosamine-4-phosphate amidinotransferase 1